MLAWTIAERFHRMAQLSAEADIYIEKKEDFKPFHNKNLNAVGKGFDFKEFMRSSQLEFWKHIQYIVESDIPNSFFVMAWDEFFDSNAIFKQWLTENQTTEFALEYSKNSKSFSFLHDKIYWEIFTIILACRGVNAVQDIQHSLLNIFVDVNRLGIFPAQCLVCNNITSFQDAIIDCAYKALEEGEDYWFEYLIDALALEYSMVYDIPFEMSEEYLSNIAKLL